MAAKVRLLGPRKHFTGQLGKAATSTVAGKLKFVSGVAELPGNYDQHKGIVNMLVKYHGAVYIPEGAPDHGTNQTATTPEQGDSTPVPGHDGPHGSESASEGANVSGGHGGAEAGTKGSVPSGHGQEDTGIHKKVKSAIAQLDHSNDEHWTKDGQPSISAVEAIVGEGGVTRAVIKQAAPDAKRVK